MGGEVAEAEWLRIDSARRSGSSHRSLVSSSEAWHCTTVRDLLST